MRTLPLVDEVLLPELDLHLELDEDLTLFLPTGALQLSGLLPGVLSVEMYPLSLRLEILTGVGSDLQTSDLPLAHLDLDGRLRLPVPPPLLADRRVVLQVRDRGLRRDFHLVADRR